MRPPPKHVINGFDERGSRGGRDGDFCRRLYTYILFVAQELERAREQEETAAKEIQNIVYNIILIYNILLWFAQELERAREQEETAAKEDMYYVQVSPSAAATPSGSQPPPFNTQQAASLCAASEAETVIGS